jgi:bifunctional N-acetylglucosamine-1-phosphate-uridyltransferase/glucosamine-1-phosphate-acetyltransferase GlmU-like protein
MIIPAAGRGSRLSGSVPKLLVPVLGKPMIDHVLDRYDHYVDRFIVVVHPDAEPAVAAHIASRRGRVELARQTSPTGMLDAILIPHARVAALQPETVWLTWCDQVAVSEATARELEQQSNFLTGTAMTLPTVRRADPYTHLVRHGSDGRIVALLQRREGDPMPRVGESEMGLFALSRAAYLDALPEFAASACEHPTPATHTVGAATGERNFLPFIPWLAARGDVHTFWCAAEIEAVGVNTPEELQLIEEHLSRS